MQHGKLALSPLDLSIFFVYFCVVLALGFFTSARIAAYDVDNPYAVELAWYPDGAGEAAA